MQAWEQKLREQPEPNWAIPWESGLVRLGDAARRLKLKRDVEVLRNVADGHHVAYAQSELHGAAWMPVHPASIRRAIACGWSRFRLSVVSEVLDRGVRLASLPGRYVPDALRLHINEIGVERVTERTNDGRGDHWKDKHDLMSRIIESIVSNPAAAGFSSQAVFDRHMRKSDGTLHQQRLAEWIEDHRRHWTELREERRGFTASVFRNQIAKMVKSRAIQ